MGSELTVEFWINTLATVVNVKAFAAILTESRFMFLTNSDRLSVRMISAIHLIAPNIYIFS